MRQKHNQELNHIFILNDTYCVTLYDEIFSKEQEFISLVNVKTVFFLKICFHWQR